MTRWGKTALHNAILSDNDLDIVQVLLDRGADPALIASRPDRSACASPGQTAVAMAARRGRGDPLAAFERRGSALNLRGLDRLLAACARNDTAAVGAIAVAEPDVVDELRADGGRFLAGFAAWTTSQACATSSISAWTPARCSRTATRTSTSRRTASPCTLRPGARATRRCSCSSSAGRPSTRRTARGPTPLALAVRACVDSYWTYRRTPESVQALLDAGASVRDVAFPSGYVEVDELLRKSSS